MSCIAMPEMPTEVMSFIRCDLKLKLFLSKDSPLLLPRKYIKVMTVVMAIDKTVAIPAPSMPMPRTFIKMGSRHMLRMLPTDIMNIAALMRPSALTIMLVLPMKLKKNEPITTILK